MDKYNDKVEIYFITDRKWATKLSEIDSRFRFGIFDYDNPDDQLRSDEIIKKLESSLKMRPIDKQVNTSFNFYTK